jgi:hypothetical protein
MNTLLIAYARPSKMLKPKILKTSFRMLLRLKALPLDR